MRVAVVGGGVVGMACAFELRRAGADVVVLERDRIGHGTSLGNTGWVCPSFTYPLPAPGLVAEGVRAALSRDGALAIRPGLDPSYLRWLWAFRHNCNRDAWLRGMRAFVALNRHTTALVDDYRSAGVAFEMHDAGLLLAALERRKLDSYVAVFRDLSALGFEGGVREVSGDEARELEPVLSERVSGGVLAEVDRWVHPLSLTQGLAAWAAGHGVELREGVTVSSVAGGRLDTSAGDLRTDAVVIAAGIASPALMRSLGVRVGIAPARGYSVTYPRDGSVTPSRALYLADALVGVSAYDRSVRLAGVFELGRRTTSVSARRLAAMLRTVDPFFAGWRASEAPRKETWAGLRPLTTDGLPLIGRSPRDGRVFLATGHGMLGVTLAPATAALLAPLVLHGRADPVLAPFDPGRRA
jgi:D-amino-acid dehydrogenase